MEETKELKLNIYEKLLRIQTELKAPKGQYNSFGKYKYRSCEDILEGIKPLLDKYKVALKISDDLESIGERYYVKATAMLIDIESNGDIVNTAYAREEETKKGMDGSQITGTASSYARKYALNGLFCIDDTKDVDTDEYKKQQDKVTPYDYMSDEDKLKASPIQESQKQWLEQNCTKTELNNALKRLKKNNLSELTYGQAEKLREVKEKQQENKVKEEKGVF